MQKIALKNARFLLNTLKKLQIAILGFITLGLGLKLAA